MKEMKQGLSKIKRTHFYKAIQSEFVFDICPPQIFTTY